jgi:hypothetical protein
MANHLLFSSIIGLQLILEKTETKNIHTYRSRLGLALITEFLSAAPHE